MDSPRVEVCPPWRIVRLNAALFPVDDFERQQWRRHGLQPVEVEAGSADELIAHLADCDGVLVVSSALPRRVITSMNSCRVISRLGLGTDKIDVGCATTEGIVVTNVPGFCAEEQADHTMMLLLALARQLPAMMSAMQEGAWRSARQLANQNRRLASRTLGLIGFGRSAVATAQRARGFGMRVLATRRQPGIDARASALGVTMVDLDTLLRESDYVSLHLPLNPSTYHLFDRSTLAKMKPGAYLINTSRGALVDETALVEALRDGRLAGAGLDTFEQIDVHGQVAEAPAHPLLSLSNVVLTPHVAAGSVEAHREVMVDGVANLATVLRGEWPPPESIVNPMVCPRFPLHN